MIPYISSKVILGFTREFQKNPFDLISQLHQNNGPVFQFRIGPYRPIIILNPDMISHILQNHQNYPKSFLYNDMKKVVGNGLITNQRKMQKAIAKDSWFEWLSFARWFWDWREKVSIIIP